MSLTQDDKAIEVFLSYSHHDEGLRNELIKHLGLLRRQGIIRAWYDRKIDPGAEWMQAIDTHLQTARIILLLLGSSDFLASDYCYDLEMKTAMARHEVGDACVIPIILRAVDWQGAPFARLRLKGLPQGSPRAWLLGIARNKCQFAYRNVARRHVIDETFVRDIQTRTLEAGMTMPEGLMIHSDNLSQLTNAMAMLSPKDRILLTLQYWKGLSAREIAEVMQMPVATVRPTISRAMTRLKDIMHRQEQ